VCTISRERERERESKKARERERERERERSRKQESKSDIKRKRKRERERERERKREQLAQRYSRKKTRSWNACACSFSKGCNLGGGRVFERISTVSCAHKRIHKE